VKVFFVTKRLAFGSAVTTWGHAEKLWALGITHIVNLRWSRNNAKVRRFPHIWLRFHDDKKPRPRWFYRRALKFYGKAIKDHRSKVFVMCHHGRCRSASLAYFLLRVSGKAPHKAERRVKSARQTARVVPAYRESAESFLDAHKGKFWDKSPVVRLPHRAGQ
jgi:protein-tyrosine phosphatase